MTDKELRTLDEMLTNLEIWSTWSKTFANEMIGICSKMRNLLADRKTENSSEKPNNCEACNHYKLTCDLFSEICKYEPIAEDCSTVDKDINVCSKDDSQLVKESTEVVKDLVKDKPQTDYTPDCPFCKRYGTEDCLGSDCRHYKTYKTEPQTENLYTDKYGDVWEWRGDAWYCISGCETCKHRDEEWDSKACDGCCENYSHYEPKDEVTISKMEQVDKDINVRSKDEPKWICARCGCVNHVDFKWCFKCGYHKPERSE